MMMQEYRSTVVSAVISKENTDTLSKFYSSSTTSIRILVSLWVSRKRTVLSMTMHDGTIIAESGVCPTHLEGSMLSMQKKTDPFTYTALLITSSFLCSSARALEMVPFAPRPPVPSCFASATASSTSARTVRSLKNPPGNNHDNNSPAYSSAPSSPTQNLIFSL
jgi:hypothetical protein